MKTCEYSRSRSFLDLLPWSFTYDPFKPIIFCLNGLSLIYFTARSNFSTPAFIWENVTMMDSWEIIASCDLEFGLDSKLND